MANRACLVKRPEKKKGASGPLPNRYPKVGSEAEADARTDHEARTIVDVTGAVHVLHGVVHFDIGTEQVQANAFGELVVNTNAP